VNDDVRGLLPLPYEATGYGENFWRAKSGPFCDKWSTGVIVLEILVGSRFLANLESYEELKEVFSGIKRVLDTDTAALLEHFLFLGQAVDIERYLEKTLVEQPDLIGENMRRCSVTVEGDKILSDLRELAYERSNSERAQRKAELKGSDGTSV
jgi:hypothetical protein